MSKIFEFITVCSLLFKELYTLVTLAFLVPLAIYIATAEM